MCLHDVAVESKSELTMDNQRADSPPPRSQNPERAASPVVGEAPASPIVHCSQYRMEEYERQNGSIPYESDGLSSYPRSPAAPRKDQYVSASDSDSEYGLPRQRSPHVTLIKNGVLYVHKDYEGLLPLCYYDTGLREGGQHDGYACFNMRDILWARRVRFHIERMRNL